MAGCLAPASRSGHARPTGFCESVHVVTREVSRRRAARSVHRGGGAGGAAPEARARDPPERDQRGGPAPAQVRSVTTRVRTLSFEDPTDDLLYLRAPGGARRPGGSAVIVPPKNKTKDDDVLPRPDSCERPRSVRGPTGYGDSTGLRGVSRLLPPSQIRSKSIPPRLARTRHTHGTRYSRHTRSSACGAAVTQTPPRLPGTSQRSLRGRAVARRRRLACCAGRGATRGAPPSLSHKTPSWPCSW